MAGEDVSVNMAMEQTVGEPAGSPKQSFLATLSDPRVTLLSVCKQWSFRRSPGTQTAVLPLSSQEGRLAQKGLNGSREIGSNQVSVAKTLSS